MIELAAMLRLIPYMLVLYVAWRKGFKFLSLYTAWVIVLVVLIFVSEIPQEVRSMLGSVSALLLLAHALDLKSRR